MARQAYRPSWGNDVVEEMIHQSPEAGGPFHAQENHAAPEELPWFCFRCLPLQLGPERNSGTTWVPRGRPLSSSLWGGLGIRPSQKSKGCGLWSVYSPERISFWFGCMEKAHLEVGSRTASKTQLWAACFGPAARPSRERRGGSLSRTGRCLWALCSYLAGMSGLVSTLSYRLCLGSGLGDLPL